MPPRRHIGRPHSKCRVLLARQLVVRRYQQARRHNLGERRAAMLPCMSGPAVSALVIRQQERPRALPSARTPRHRAERTSYSSTGIRRIFPRPPSRTRLRRVRALAHEQVPGHMSVVRCQAHRSSRLACLSSRSGSDSMLSTVHACRCCVSPLSEASIALITIATTRCVESPTRLRRFLRCRAVRGVPFAAQEKLRMPGASKAWTPRDVHPPIGVLAGGHVAPGVIGFPREERRATDLCDGRGVRQHDRVGARRQDSPPSTHATRSAPRSAAQATPESRPPGPTPSRRSAAPGVFATAPVPKTEPQRASPPGRSAALGWQAAWPGPSP